MSLIADNEHFIGRPLLTPSQAAALLSVSAATVKRLCASGRLKAIDVGTGEYANWRIPRDALLNIEPRFRPKAEVRSIRSVPQAKPYVLIHVKRY